MEEELISKKDLLELTNISYGQLYRWKRKGLIPEEWFIRKSAFTGQETFFPKNKVLSRIDKIINMKDDISLDDIADVFSSNVDNMSLSLDEITNRNIVTKDVFKIYMDFRGEVKMFDFNDILSVYILNRVIVPGNISMEEGRLMLEVLREGLIKWNGVPSEIFLMRKLGVFSCFLVSPPCGICFDSGIRLIDRIKISTVIEELKLKLI